MKDSLFLLNGPRPGPDLCKPIVEAQMTKPNIASPWEITAHAGNSYLRVIFSSFLSPALSGSCWGTACRTSRKASLSPLSFCRQDVPLLPRTSCTGTAVFACTENLLDTTNLDNLHTNMDAYEYARKALTQVKEIQEAEAASDHWQHVQKNDCLKL